MAKLYVGIDPGWTNLGLSVVKVSDGEGVKVLYTEAINPSSFPSPLQAIRYIFSKIEIADGITFGRKAITALTIERYVAYQGVLTSTTEEICMLIGGLDNAASNLRIPVNLIRAIDWKTGLVKELYLQKGFENPSASLDKKFSIAAAKACLDTPYEFKTDHEADATCLACYPTFVKERNWKFK